MPSYQTIKSQVQQARSQLESQKRTVESEEDRIRNQERLLASLQTRKPPRKLGYQQDPQYHTQLQRHLEEQKFRQEQKIILEKAKKKIREYRSKTLSPYGSQVSQAEGKIGSYEKEQQAFDTAQNLFDKNRSWAFESGRVRHYLKKFYRSEASAKISFDKKIDELQAQLPPGEKLIVDWERTSVGLESGALGMSFPSLESYSQEVGKYAPPQFAYKDIITGEVFSTAPEFAHKGFVPVAITPEGKELPVGEQFRLKATRPELFEPLDIQKAAPPVKELKPFAEKAFEKVKEYYPGAVVYRAGKPYAEKVYEKIPDAELRVETGFPIGVAKPLITPIPSETAVPLSEIIGTPEAREEKTRQIIEEELKETGIRAKLDPAFQARYQSAFEREYAGKISSGEITFETASKSFETSASAKEISKKYIEAIRREREKLGFTWRGAKVTGISFLGALPTTYKGLAVASVGAYAGYRVLTASKLLGAGYLAYVTGAGAYKALAPAKLPEERAAGVTEAALGVGLLTYAGVRYARAPVLKPEKISISPRLKEFEKSLRISPTLERQAFTLAGEEKFVKDIHKMAKLDEQIITGRRVVVTTKIRKKLGLKDIYGGVPYSDPKAYGKALKKLKKYGATESEARASLRYHQPKALMSEMEGVAEVVYGEKLPKPEIHIRKAERVTTPEQRIIDEALGIKTRVGKKKIEYIVAKGVEVGAVEDATIYKFLTRTEEALLTKAGRPFTPIRKAGKVKTTYEQLSGVRPEVKIPLTDKATMEILREVSNIKQIIPPKRAITRTKGRVIKYDIEREIPTITYDIEAITGMRVRKIPTYKKPEPTPKLVVKDLIKDLEKIYGKPGKKPKKIITAWDRKRHEKRVGELRTYLKELSGKERAEIAKTARAIYGEPMVEIVPAVIKKPPVQAVAGGIPKIKPTKDLIKDISKIEAKLYEKVGAKGRLRLGVGVVAREKERLKEAMQLGQQMAQVEKQALKEAVQLGQVPRQTQRLRQVQKMQLKQALIPKQLLKTILTPSIARPLRFKTPPPTEVKSPIIPFPSLDISREVLKKKLKKGKREKVWTYTPSFTARALGLKPIKLGTDISLKKLMKQMQTGLGVRAPVVVR